MDSSSIHTCTLSATLQYVGIRFCWFVHTLQQRGEDLLWEKIDWHAHVLAEVVQCLSSNHIKWADQSCRQFLSNYLQCATSMGWWCRFPWLQPKWWNGCLLGTQMHQLWCARSKPLRSSRHIPWKPESTVHGPHQENGGYGVSLAMWYHSSQLVREAQQLFPQNQVSSQQYENTLLIIIHCSRGNMAFPAYSKVKKTLGLGMEDIKLQTQHLFNAVDEKIFCQNAWLHHLVNHMSMVEYLTDPHELEKKWVVSADKFWRGTDHWMYSIMTHKM